MTSSRRPSRWWYGVVILLSFELFIYWDYDFPFYLNFSVFLPLIAAHLAWKHGVQAASVIVLMGFLASIGLAGEIEVAYENLSIYWGLGWDHLLLSIGLAIVFCRPPMQGLNTDLLNLRWNRLRWLIPIALWFAVFYYGLPRWDLRGGLYSLINEVTVEAHPGMVALLLIMAVCTDWQSLGERLRQNQASISMVRTQWLLVLAGMFLLSLPIGLRFEFFDDMYELATGFSAGGGFRSCLCPCISGDRIRLAAPSVGPTLHPGLLRH